jgi:hypothetical protein
VDALDDRLGFCLVFGRAGFNLHGRLLSSRDRCAHLLADALQLGRSSKVQVQVPVRITDRAPVAEGARTIGDAGAGHPALRRDLGRGCGVLRELGESDVRG